MPRHLGQGALLGAMVGLFVLLLWWGGVLTPFENLTWRWRAMLCAGQPPATPVVIIAVDQASLDWGRQENGLSWPWPREAYRLILEFCKRAGARAVAFDLLFTESSAYGVEDDLALAKALGELPVAGAVALSHRSVAADEFPLPRIAVADWPPRAISYDSAALPVVELRQAFAGLGNVSAAPDPDGIYRRVPLVDRFRERPVPGLPLALLLTASPAAAPQLTAQGLSFGGHIVPLDPAGQAIVRFRGPAGTFPTLSAAAVIQSELRLREGGVPVVEPARLRDAYVIFGLIAPGLYDLRATPVDAIFPGVEIHATVLDNLLHEDFLHDAPWFTTVLLTLVIAVLAGMAIRMTTHIPRVLLIAALSLPLPLLLGITAYRSGWWLPVAPPVAACAASILTALLVNYAIEGRQRRFIKQAFNQYLHPTVIDQLLTHPERLRLGGERREITVFFSDLQGFSGLAEQLDPEALTTLLNDYLTAMTDIILDQGGTVDKYVGDAIVAFWNAPLDQPDHAGRAVRTAQLCQARLNELRPQLWARSGQELRMRIGINTGVAVVGNMGSQRRFDYTVLGDAVNLASRLEGVNKEFGTSVLLAATTRDQLDDSFQLREVGCVQVVGRAEPVRIFEPFQMANGAGDRLQKFSAALAHYYAGEFQAATAVFIELAEDDVVAGCYVERCRQLLATPPTSWDGIWRLDSK